MARKKRSSRKAAPAFKRAPRRKATRSRSRSRRRSGLSELMTPAGAMAAAKGIAKGAAGGVGAGIVHDMMASQNPLLRIGVEVIGSALAFTMFDPNVGAGMAGGFAACETVNMRSKFLNDGGQYADPDAINELPPVLNEHGEQMTLMESDGQQFYLDERSGNTYLCEEVYPQFAPGNQ